MAKSTNSKRKNKIKQLWFSKGQRRCRVCCVQLNWAAGHKNSASIDHVIPVKQKGTYAQINCIVICRSCNQERGHMRLSEFARGKNVPNLSWFIKKEMEAEDYYEHCYRG